MSFAEVAASAIAFARDGFPVYPLMAEIIGAVDDDRRHAGEVHVFGLHHAQRDAAGDAGVDRIAARFQDAEARLGGEVVAGGHHVARPHDGRAMGLHVVLHGRMSRHLSFGPRRGGFENRPYMRARGPE
jgi:hypothetical protein